MDTTIRIIAVLFVVVAVACIAVLLSGAHAGNSDGVTGHDAENRKKGTGELVFIRCIIITDTGREFPPGFPWPAPAGSCCGQGTDNSLENRDDDGQE